MPIRRPAALGHQRAVAAVLALVVSACSSTESPAPTGRAATPSAAAAAATPVPTLPPTPTPAPTPRFTNPADPDLAALIPTTVRGVAVTIPTREDHALTPGDVGLAFGELGVRFSSLVLAYVEQPRLTLYAVRVDAPPVTTADLEPHLATAGRYVGIAGLDREAWQLTTIAGGDVWTRAGDIANPPGTTLYAWAAADLVFLLVGSDDAMNRALVEALPHEAVPAPAAGSPRPSPSAGGG